MAAVMAAVRSSLHKNDRSFLLAPFPQLARAVLSRGALKGRAKGAYTQLKKLKTLELPALQQGNVGRDRGVCPENRLPVPAFWLKQNTGVGERRRQTPPEKRFL